MKLIFLGTGHGSATPTHISSITYLETAGKSYLVDCADGADAEMLRKHLNPEALSAIFITHMHMDHNGGLPVVMKRLMKHGEEDASPVPVMLAEPEAAEVIEKWLVINGFPKVHGRFVYPDPEMEFDDGTVKVNSFHTKHLAASGRPSFGYSIASEGKKLFFTGDLKFGDCADFPLEPARGSDLMVCELTHFRMPAVMPFLEKLEVGRLIFNHLGNWSQVPEEQARIRETCASLPYPVELAFDGMELTL